MFEQISAMLNLQSLAFLFFALAIGFSAGSRVERGFKAVRSLTLTSVIMFFFGWVSAFFVIPNIGIKQGRGVSSVQIDGNLLLLWTSFVILIYVIGLVLGLMRSRRARRADVEIQDEPNPYSRLR